MLKPFYQNTTSRMGTLPKSSLLGFAKKGSYIESDQSREPSAEESFVELCSKRNR